MIGAIDAVCDVAERIISKLKEGGTAGAPSLLGSTGGNGTGTYPPTPSNALLTASSGKRASNHRPAIRRRYRSVANSLANTRLKSPTVKRPVSSTPNQ